MSFNIGHMMCVELYHIRNIYKKTIVIPVIVSRIQFSALYIIDCIIYVHLRNGKNKHQSIAYRSSRLMRGAKASGSINVILLWCKSLEKRETVT